MRQEEPKPVEEKPKVSKQMQRSLSTNVSKVAKKLKRDVSTKKPSGKK